MERKTCKHCGRPNATIEKISSYEFYVICPDCGTCTEKHSSYSHALKAWHSGVVTHITEMRNKP